MHLGKLHPGDGGDFVELTPRGDLLHDGPEVFVGLG